MRDVVVFDRTQSLTLIKFWDFDWIHLADDWTPMKQVEGAVTNDVTKTREVWGTYSLAESSITRSS